MSDDKLLDTKSYLIGYEDGKEVSADIINSLRKQNESLKAQVAHLETQVYGGTTK